VLENRALMADGITPVAAPPLSGTVGVPITNALFATYTITDPSAGPGDQWRALINFGDGQKDGQVIPVQKGDQFQFIDTHTYNAAGTYTVTVMIALPGSHNPNDNIVTTQVTITQPTPPPTPTPPPSPRFRASGLAIQTRVDKDLNRSVALFSEPNSVARNFQADIDWGDQSATEQAQILVRGNGRYAVVGHHRYLNAGRYQATVTIQDASGREIAAHSPIYVRSRLIRKS
jgi:hypothetical protein